MHERRLQFQVSDFCRQLGQYLGELNVENQITVVQKPSQKVCIIWDKAIFCKEPFETSCSWTESASTKRTVDPMTVSLPPNCQTQYEAQWLQCSVAVFQDEGQEAWLLVEGSPDQGYWTTSFALLYQSVQLPISPNLQSPDPSILAHWTVNLSKDHSHNCVGTPFHQHSLHSLMIKNTNSADQPCIVTAHVDTGYWIKQEGSNCIPSTTQ